MNREDDTAEVATMARRGVAEKKMMAPLCGGLSEQRRRRGGDGDDGETCVNKGERIADEREGRNYEWLWRRKGEER